MYVILDIGGTNTRIGISKSGVKLDNIKRFQTPKSLEELTSQISQNLPPAKDIKAICVGIAGFVNYKQQSVEKSPHVPYLNTHKVSEIIKLNGIPLYIQNDAALAGLAEAILGEGKNYNRVAYITISTGVGGTLIIEKQIQNTTFNFEPGHHIINFDEVSDSVSFFKGSWEDYSSGTAFPKLHNIESYDCSDKTIWTKYSKHLAVGLLNIILLWRPDIIVLGGSLTKKSDLFLDTAIKKLEDTLPHEIPPIKISQLGDENGLLGGLEYLRSGAQ